MSQTIQAKPEGNTVTSGPRTQLYRWCFTIPYEELSASQLSQNLRGFCKEFTFSGEIGESGYKHWQGVFSLKVKEYMPTVKNLFPNSTHLEGCKHWWKAINYCMKIETHIEGPYDMNSIFLKLPDKLYPWQSDVIDIILNEPDDRTIHWFWEPKGCRGKTTLCKYLAVKHGAVVMNNCGSRDGSYILPDAPRVVVINLTRSNEDFINYGLMEAIKDGLIFSPKYESCMKIFNSPHLLVFSNSPPDRNKMSDDRWNVHKL